MISQSNRLQASHILEFQSVSIPKRFEQLGHAHGGQRLNPRQVCVKGAYCPGFQLEFSIHEQAIASKFILKGLKAEWSARHPHILQLLRDALFLLSHQKGLKVVLYNV